MAFNISSSTAPAVDLNRAADGRSHSTLANVTHKVSNLARGLMARYVSFDLNILNASLRTFSSSPQGAMESSFDQNAFMKSIFDQAKHRISGKQNEFDAALRRMHDVLNAASTQENPAAAPHLRPQPAVPQQHQQTSPDTPDTAHAQQPEPARAEHDPQEQARRQAQQRHASHLRRTHEETGRNNALSLLGGHAAPGSHEQFGNYGVPADDRDAAILEENQRLRDLIDALEARTPAPAGTNHE